MRDFLKGPFAQEASTIKILYLILFLFLTCITEVGGLLLWPFMAIPYYDHPKWKNFQTLFYALCFYVLCSWLIIPTLASFANRTPLPCFSKDGIPFQSQTKITCLLHRNYVEKDVYVKMMNVAKQMDRHYNRVDIRYLSAGLPFGIIPVFPNLIQNKGRAISMSFLWTDSSRRMTKTAPSPVGYGSHSISDFSRTCSADEFLKIAGISIPLRYQWLFLNWNSSIILDEKRSNTLLHYLGRHKDVAAIFLEPELHRVLGKDVSSLYPNPCSWMLHDDHFTILFSTPKQ